MQCTSIVISLELFLFALVTGNSDISSKVLGTVLLNVHSSICTVKLKVYINKYVKGSVQW